MTVTFLPFPTALLAEYLTTPYAQPAIVFFCAPSLLHNLGWLGLLQTSLRADGTLKYQAVAEVVDMRRASLVAGAVYLGTPALAGWQPIAA